MGSWAGWENAPDDFLWGVVWVVDHTNSSNSQSYVNQVGYSFTNYFYEWIYKNVAYTSSTPAQITYKWGDPDNIWCQPVTSTIIFGP
jgi:hypothetical protein